MAIQMRRGLKKDFDPGKMLPGEWAVAVDDDTQNQIIWMCFAAGVVKRIGTYEDFFNQITEITGDILEQFQQALTETQEQLQNATEEYIQGKVDDEWIPQMQALLTKTQASEANAAKSQAAAAESAKAAAASQTAAATSEKNAADSAKAAAASQAAASASEKAAESWAVGETGTRTGEDTDNSKYYSLQSQNSADRAAAEAANAAKYSEVIAPGFYLDPETMTLYMKSGKAVDFKVVDDNVLCWKFTA